MPAVKANWYETFFHGLAVDLWINAVSPEQTRTEADFLQETLAAPAGSRLLDVPCGNGRHALELAARGYRMTGVDLSSEFLDHARRQSATAGSDVDWRQSDMRRLPWDGEFDGAFCFGNSFGYLEPEGMQEFVAAVARALKPGARFVLQTGVAAETLLPNLSEREWYRMGDVLMLIANEYDAAHSCLDTTYTFLRDGKVETGESTHWVYTCAEIQRLLARRGLETKGLYSGLDRAPFRLGTQVLYVVAERNSKSVQHP